MTVEEIKAIVKQTIAEMAFKYDGIKPLSSRPITNISLAYELIMEYINEERSREALYVIGLSTSLHPVFVERVCAGNVGSAGVRLAEVFRTAVKNDVPNIIVAHNHPSGNLEPSQADIELTKSMIAAADLLEINIIDHIIIGKDDYRSIKWMVG